ncbi:MAG: 3-deoxy-manno-octulosonate cytidylyltransferase [Bacteroidota bacterium]
MKSIAIIPARYSSSRFPGKPLVEINGLPMIVLVWQNIQKSRLINTVIVATDDERIANTLDKYQIPFVLTNPQIPTGTDRIYSAYRQINTDFDIVINVQGDEPLLSGSDLDKLIENFDTREYDVATFISPIDDFKELVNPNNVKVAVGENYRALYFSRSVIPHLRDFEINEWLKKQTYWKHIGIYAYKANVLEFFVNTPQTKIELSEKLEQLRLLEHGYRFQCIPLNKKLIGVDTPEDLEKIKVLFNKNN